MKLSHYMELKNLSEADLAELLEKVGEKRDRTTIARWRKETIRPDWGALKAIEAITRRKVTASDFLDLVPGE